MKRPRFHLVGILLVGFLLSGHVAQGFFDPTEVRTQEASGVAVNHLAEDTPLAPSPHPILSDVNIRRAIAYCTNKDALIDAAYPGLAAIERMDLIADGFIRQTSWAYVIPATIYPYDPVAGQTLLDAAGWLLQPGEVIRMKEGKQLTLELTTTDAPLRLLFMPVFEQQMLACGIRVIRLHGPNLSPLTWRDYELAEFAWVMERDEPGGAELYACDQVPAPDNDWTGNNHMGWCNEDASLAITHASDTTLSQALRIPYYQTFMDIFAEEMPSLPLFWRLGDTPIFEHIDFNLETYLQLVDVTPDAEANLVYAHYWDTHGTVAIPAGAVAEEVSIGYYPQMESSNPAPEGLISFAPFSLTAFLEGVAQDTYVLEKPITVIINYPPDIGLPCQGCANERTLSLYVWNGETWEDAQMSCPVESRYELLDVETNTYEVNVCHLSEFIMAGEPVFWSFFPALFR